MYYQLKLSAISIMTVSVLSMTPYMASHAFAAEETPIIETTELSTPAVDYALMETFMSNLSSNERGRPSIAYAAARENGAGFFSHYETQLVAVDVEALSEDDQLAYWLNLQNFLVVKAVTLDTKKTNLKSLRGTAKKPGKMWTKDRVTIGGQSYSIADIEAKITSNFKDPNVIYGLYQGVKGGPCLSSKPYEGATVTARLAELGAHYVNSRGIVTPNKSVVTLTPIYDWHKAALFDGEDAAILRHVKAHASTNLRGRLNRGTRVEYTKLNYVTDSFDPKKQVQGVKKRAPQQQRAPQTRVPSGGGSYGS